MEKRINRKDLAKMFAKLRAEGKTYSEIAAELRVSKSTVKRLAADAKAKEQPEAPKPQYSEALVEISKYAVMDCAGELWRICNILESVSERGAFNWEECARASLAVRSIADRLSELK